MTTLNFLQQEGDDGAVRLSLSAKQPSETLAYPSLPDTPEEYFICFGTYVTLGLSEHDDHSASLDSALKHSRE